MKNQKLRFAVIGARRGTTFIRASQALGADVELSAVCDISAEALQPWREETGLKLYENYEQVLDDPEVDAVCLATPVPYHARQAIAALQAGKHVMSEVTAAYTLEECWDLVRAVEQSGLTYMMAENYCYSEPVLQIQHMVEQGVFGDLIYAAGSYIHDCRELFFSPDGGLTWRGQIRRERTGNTYPTHSLGPVAKWLGINQTDFFDTTASWQSPSRAKSHYAQRNWPDKEDYLNPTFWNHPDTVSTTLHTERGVLVDIRVDWSSPRPHHMTRYELQGTTASFCWPDGLAGRDPLIWIEDRSETRPSGVAKEWDSLWKYREEFQHPLWREHRAAAEKTGHGGGDYFVLREFVTSIRENRAPAINVYDAVTWSCLTPLSEESIARGNIPVKVPRFQEGTRQDLSNGR